MGTSGSNGSGLFLDLARRAPMHINGLEPTMDSVPSIQPPGPLGLSVDIAQPAVGFVQGTRPHFSGETVRLLRGRLTATALVLSIILASAFVGNLFAEYAPLTGLRAIILVVFRGLEKPPANRFPDAESLDKALTACQCAGNWTEDRAAEWWKGIGQIRAASLT